MGKGRGSTADVGYPKIANRVIPDTSTSSAIMDDANASKKAINGSINYKRTNDNRITIPEITSETSDYSAIIRHANGLYTRSEIDLYNKAFRFGVRNPYTAFSTGREYLFFTKPDLNIIGQDIFGIPGSTLHSSLASIPFWADLFNKRRNTIRMLEQSLDNSSPFNFLLQNQVKSNLDVPGLTAEMIDTPVNAYGVGYSYRGTSESSNDNPEFSLEFRDTKYLDVYYFFKAYEEYETLIHHGVIAPAKIYIINKILHDAFSIYKFIVDEDMETIVYYGKMYGVMPKSLPRDVFSSPEFEDGISYSIDFKAAFYEDMTPEILADFNSIAISSYNAANYKLTPYNAIIDGADMRPAKAAYVKTVNNIYAPGGKSYKLVWKGDDRV